MAIFLGIILLAITIIILMSVHESGRTGYSRAADNLIRTKDYLTRLEQVFSAPSISALPSSEAMRAWGDYGEVWALHLFETVGGGIVYWNVGVNYLPSRRSEIDILAITRQGVLHVEVKHYSGRWQAAQGEPGVNPNAWEKQNPYDGQIKTTRSPFSQVMIAHSNLADAIRAAIGVTLPVHSVVFFTHDSFAMDGFSEDRSPFYLRSEIAPFVRSFMRNTAGTNEMITPVHLAKLVSYLGAVGQEPVFFDKTFYSELEIADYSTQEVVGNGIPSQAA
ncbi:MAG: NERD domain-containing protein [Proteobacteria bacterium]|nr:NERD domain-containing protein [Pseudomonadota bacterium]